MKRILMVFTSSFLLVGCAHDRYREVGGTTTPADIEYGTQSSPPPAVNDLDDLGYQSRDFENVKPNGQPRVPGHSIDIYNGR